MFNHVGRKIQIFSILFFVISIIILVPTGLYFLSQASRILDILLLIVGALISVLLIWFFSLLIYGYGQIVENSEIVAENMYKLEYRPSLEHNKK